MPWKSSDNPVPNKIDRVFVSQTEYWEMNYFVDHYLKEHGYGITVENRDIVKQAIPKFPGKAPFKRDDLIEFLNKEFKR